MKTVMKKMFSLLLVAVMLVGIMPFQAFADTDNTATEGTVTAVLKIGSAETTMTETRAAGWETSINDIITVWFQEDSSRFSHAAFLDNNGEVTTTTSDLNSTVTVGNVVHIRLHEAAVPEKCDTCGKDKHDGVVCCSKCKDTGHSDVNHCTYCNSLEHLSTVHCTVCEEIGCDSSKHCTLCGSKEHSDSLHCTECGELGHYASAHCSICNEVNCSAANHCGVCAAKDHTTANCPYCSVCYANGDKNVTLHNASAHCTVCGVVNGHTSDCSSVTYPATGDAKLYVWADLVVGNSEKETILLDTIEGLSGNDLIYQVVARNESRLRSKIPNGYSWTGHVYYEQDPKTELTVKSTMTVADDDDVVINLYTNEKLVVARVHTGKNYTVDRLIDVGGFQVGDVVNSSDVLKAVKKYYSVSSMKMYTPGDWEKIVSGGSASTIPNFTVTSGDNIIDVYVTGSRISSSGTTYTADSSNPKTGDMIFAPAAVLGLSVSALAVLFFLNKKRAY